MKISKYVYFLLNSRVYFLSSPFTLTMRVHGVYDSNPISAVERRHPRLPREGATNYKQCSRPWTFLTAVVPLMLLQAAAATSAGRQTTAFPPLVGRHRRRRAAEQAGPDQRGGREDGAHARRLRLRLRSSARSRSFALTKSVPPSLRRPSASSVIIGGDSPLRLRRRCFGVCRCRTGWERSYNLQDISISGHLMGM